MKQIPLTCGFSVFVDDADFDFLSQWNWHYNRGGLTGHNGYAVNRNLGMMHRIIMQCPPLMSVDHIDRIGLNNQRSNLRLASHSENMCNRIKRVTRESTSMFKGVSKNGRRWYVEIRVDGKRHGLGGFDCEISAALAYNKAALEYYGEFAVLNDIPVLGTIRSTL